MEALNLTRGPSMHWEVVGVKQYNPTLTMFFPYFISILILLSLF